MNVLHIPYITIGYISACIIESKKDCLENYILVKLLKAVCNGEDVEDDL